MTQREVEVALFGTEVESQGMKVADGSSDDPHVSEAVTGLSSRGGAKRTKSTAKTPTVMKTAMKTAMKTGPGKPVRKPKGWSAGVTFVPHPPGWKPPVLRQARLAEFQFLKKGSGEGTTVSQSETAPVKRKSRKEAVPGKTANPKSRKAAKPANPKFRKRKLAHEHVALFEQGLDGGLEGIFQDSPDPNRVLPSCRKARRPRITVSPASNEAQRGSSQRQVTSPSEDDGGEWPFIPDSQGIGVGLAISGEDFVDVPPLKLDYDDLDQLQDKLRKNSNRSQLGNVESVAQMLKVS